MIVRLDEVVCGEYARHTGPDDSDVGAGGEGSRLGKCGEPEVILPVRGEGNRVRQRSRLRFRQL